MLLRIGRSVSLHQDFSLLFPQCRQTQVYMCEYTIVMVDICKKIVVQVDGLKSVRSQLQAFFFTSFDSDFKSLETSLSEWGRLIEKRSAVLAIKSNAKGQSNSLERLSRLQADFSKDAANRLRDSRKNRLFNLLSPNQQEFDRTWRRERKKGTSNWVLKDVVYQKWRSSRSSTTLWLQGNLGSGKSVTMASIVADLVLSRGTASDGEFGQLSLRGRSISEKENNSPSIAEKTWRDTQWTVSHHFCKADNPKTLQADNIIGSLVLQILADPALATTLTQYLGSEDAVPGYTLGAERCVDILLKIAPLKWRGVFVLDGLDEASTEEVEELFIQLKRLMRERNVLLCCSSRPTAVCKNIATDSVGVNLTLSMENADRSDDIEGYILAGVERWKTIRPVTPELEELIVKQLLLGSQGMFLWLSLQMEAICPRYTQELRSEADIVDIINNLPRNLPEAFDQALLRVIPKGSGSKIFELVASAEPPLSPDELRIAFNVEPGNTTWNPATLKGSGYTLVSEYGGSLLDIDEEDSCVRFIHHSVFLHLVGPPSLSASAPFHFEIETAEATLGGVCVTYLNYSIFETQISTTHKASFHEVPGLVAESVGGQRAGLSQRVFAMMTRGKRNSSAKVDLERLVADLEAYKPKFGNDIELFLFYAKKNWLNLSRGYLEKRNTSIDVLWTRLCSGFGPSILGTLPWAAGSHSAATRWAISNGHGFLFRHLLRTLTGPPLEEVFKATIQLHRDVFMDANQGHPPFRLSGKRLGSLIPYYILQRRKDIEVADLMVFISLKCLPFGVGKGYNQFPDPELAKQTLNTAARTGIQKAFKLMEKPEVERKKDWGCSSVVRYLTTYLEDIDAVLDNGKTTLHTAIDCGVTELAVKLAEDGANINIQNDDGETALLVAVKDNDNDAVSKLLESGADPNLADHQGVAPLHLARGSMIRELTVVGANRSVLGPDGITPLMLAVFRGDVRAVESLLEVGPTSRIATNHRVQSPGPLSKAGRDLFTRTRNYNDLSHYGSKDVYVYVDDEELVQEGDTALSLAIRRLETLNSHMVKVYRTMDVEADKSDVEGSYRDNLGSYDTQKRWQEFQQIVMELPISEADAETYQTLAKHIRQYEKLPFWEPILAKFEGMDGLH